MNERIKSLIERAEYQAQKQSGSDWEVHVEPSREQIFEKFAELIVRECLDEIQYDDGATHVDELLPNHFGFEL
jgi:hypothetical protein